MNKLQIKINTYLSYDCYDKLKYYFDRTKLTDSAEKYLETSIQKFNNKPRNLNADDKLFRKFANYLEGDGAFLRHDSKVTCNYINFWLNDQVKGPYNHIYGSKFQLFIDFAKHFGMERKNNNKLNHSCEGYIKKLDGYEYRVRKILYDLYYWYIEHKWRVQFTLQDPLCSNISLIHSQSTNAKGYIEKDEDLKKLIKELKDIIQREKPNEQKCKNYNIPNFMLPDVIIPPKVEEQETERNRLITGDPSPKDQRTHLGQGIDVSVTDDKSLVLETEQLAQEPALPEHQRVINVDMNPLEVSYGQQLHTNFQPEEKILKTLSQGEQAYRTRSTRTRLSEEEIASADQNLHQLEDTHGTKGNKGGMFGTIGESVINLLGDVEPAPILGVSGGMGALFLLFKVL
ncbi:hypothetical protein PVMG_06056 [Plasmodium vivax Mauritania I]|uniref:VIR protein n=1 Tax=Plasmodium vivax Mauritania I TaxID=1035515 RepID=A0A0J9VQZ1_PLAVI|nr:hypothetical protein PVMG_06056 [Plasmodium vivax Mauritania I]